MRVIPKSRGFTLLEMVLAIVVMGVMAAVGGQIIGGGVEVYNATNASLKTLSKARYTAERLAREVREIRYVGNRYDIANMKQNRLTFTKRDGETVTIDSSPPRVTLSYASIASTPTLTDQVSDFSFTYYKADLSSPAKADNVAYIDMQFTLIEGSTPYPRRVRVALRDKP